jgi:hypothetical protein
VPEHQIGKVPVFGHHNRAVLPRREKDLSIVSVSEANVTQSDCIGALGRGQPPGDSR